MKKEINTMDKPKPATTNEVKKMKQGMSYTCKEKTIILNVFKYFRTEYPDKCITELVRRTSKATGCSEKSIFHFRKEETRPGGFKEPSKTKIRKNLNINSRDIKYDDSVRQAIKNIIYDLRYKNVSTSLSMILKQIALDASLPSFSVMTLRRLLMDMGFYYEKNGKKSILMERDDIKKENCNNKKKVVDVKKNSHNVDLKTNDELKINVPEKNESKITGNEIQRNSDLNTRIIDPNNSHQNKIFPGGNNEMVNNKVGYNQPGINNYNNQYNSCNPYEFPMHLGHENHRYPMDFYHHHQNHHNGALLNNRMPPPPHMVQSPWIHTQNQSILGLPNN